MMIEKLKHVIMCAMNERWQRSLVDRLRKPEQLWGRFEVSTGDCSEATVLLQANHQCASTSVSL